ILERLVEQVSQLIFRKAKHAAFVDEPLPFFSQPLPLAFEAPLGDHVGDERTVAVAHFEELFGGEPLVDPEHGVLVDGQIARELPDGRDSGAWGERPGETLGPNLVGELPRDGDRRIAFNPDKHGNYRERPSSDYSSITVFSWRARGQRQKKIAAKPTTEAGTVHRRSFNEI